MKRPPRFALHHPITDATAIIEGDELHHLRDVMRLREGADIALLATDGVEHLGHIEKYDGDRAIIRIEKTVRVAKAYPLILAAALIKGPRMDFMVEKTVELGATELWPMLCARGVVRAPGLERIARWRRLALAAAKQSLAPTPPVIHPPISFADLIDGVVKDTLAMSHDDQPLRLICRAGAEPIASAIRNRRPRGVLLACGPEGDFDDEEIALAKRAEFMPVGLGHNRLRSETAALAAVSMAAAILDEIRAGD
jgi:16S rRNA (uracil1498-N3)-methyltransferase